MSTSKKIDDDFYSRSIFTYGIDTQKKLSKMKVLIVDMRGLGVETAKNIILSGIGEVDIYDPKIVNIKDLGSNFFLSEEDVGKKNRDEACLEKLAQLNSYVKVGLLKIEHKNNIDEYKVCREKNIKLIYGMCLGLVGYVFTDFGKEHIIINETGEEIEPYLVKSITKDENGLVTIADENDLSIKNGDYIRFKEVEGMIELNEEGKEFQIILENNKSFKIGDTSNFKEYKKGGKIYKIIKPIKKQYYDFYHRSTMICDDDHPFNIVDNTKIGRQELLYMALRGVHDFYIQNNYTLPELNNMEQTKSILEQVKKIYDTAKENNFLAIKIFKTLMKK